MIQKDKLKPVVRKYLLENNLLVNEAIIIPIKVGINDDTYLINIKNNKSVLKIVKRNKIGQTLGFTKQINLIKYLSSFMITPKLIHSSDKHSILLFEYKEDSCNKNKFNINNTKRILSLLKELHKLEFDLPHIEIKRNAKEYIKFIGGEQNLDIEKKKWCKDMYSLASFFDNNFPGNSLCHNDLVSENIIDDGKIWLIDFEYAIRSDPVIDLAGIVAMNNYDLSKIKDLIEIYYSGKEPFSIKVFNDIVYLLRLLSYFWTLSYSKQTKSKDKLIFARYIEEMIK